MCSFAACHRRYTSRSSVHRHTGVHPFNSWLISKSCPSHRKISNRYAFSARETLNSPCIATVTPLPISQHSTHTTPHCPAHAHIPKKHKFARPTSAPPHTTLFFPLQHYYLCCLSILICSDSFRTTRTRTHAKLLDFTLRLLFSHAHRTNHLHSPAISHNYSLT